MDYHLGIDIGASSGRHMLGRYVDGKLELEEIYRFKNAIRTINGQDCWDIETLFAEILKGIRACVDKNKIPKTLAIDTWGCDFVLLDKNKERIGACVSYRDNRVDGIMEKAFRIKSKNWIYERTGIQFQKFNTLYQLLALKEKAPEQLAQAEYFLMIPDYLNFLLTGAITNEYTNASTTQMVNAGTQTWDEELIEAFGLPRHIFQIFTKAGESIGSLRPEIIAQTGVDIKVIACAGHDTASAYIGAKEQKQIILSSGTWSLLGIVAERPILNEAAQRYNFTNEGYIDGKFRFLKNIMGLWMIQEVQRCLETSYSFAELVDLAKSFGQEPPIVDVNDPRFLHPQNMIAEIQDHCRQTGQRVPEEVGDIANTVYHSLANSYRQAVNELEEVCGCHFDIINIVGGGCKNQYLNELTGQYTGKKIVIGPDEATVTGNIQMQQKGE